MKIRIAKELTTIQLDSTIYKAQCVLVCFTVLIKEKASFQRTE